jgi:hypothetical protein
VTIKFFPTNFVASKKVEQHEEIKAELLPRILHYAEEYKDSRQHKWDNLTRSNMVTTYNYGVDKDTADIILNKYIKFIVWDLMHEVANYAGVMGFEDAGVTNLWWNVYQKGDWAEMHTHSAGVRGNPNYSGVYFLDIKGENTLEFVSPVLSSTHPIDSTFHTMHGKDIPEGHVVIFPSSLMHHVRPVPDRRVTISFNVACKYPNMPDDDVYYPTDPNVVRPR